MTAAPPEWYARWASRHLTAFGLSSEAAAQAFASWWPAFASLKATEGELQAATGDCLASDPDQQPTFVDGHLRSLKASIGRQRNRAAAKASAGPLDERKCGWCGDSGWCVVPLPQDVTNGEWRPGSFGADGNGIYRTAAATCTCGSGLRTSAALADSKRPPMTIEAVAAKNPRWREMVEASTRKGAA